MTLCVSSHFVLSFLTMFTFVFALLIKFNSVHVLRPNLSVVLLLIIKNVISLGLFLITHCNSTNPTGMNV